MEIIKKKIYFKCYKCSGVGKNKEKIDCPVCKGTGKYEDEIYYFIKNGVAWSGDTLK